MISVVLTNTLSVEFPEVINGICWVKGRTYHQSNCLIMLQSTLKLLSSDIFLKVPISDVLIFEVPAHLACWGFSDTLYTFSYFLSEKSLQT